MVYEGTKDYIFVSYAHKDARSVIPTVDALSNAGFRVWYDSGIEAGTEWPEYIEEHLEGASVVLVFMTPAAVQSRNCRNEINLALELKKEVLVVYLEETTLLKGMRLQLNSTQSLFKNNHPSSESFLNALMSAKMLQCCREGGMAQSSAPNRSSSTYKNNNQYNPVAGGNAQQTKLVTPPPARQAPPATTPQKQYSGGNKPTYQPSSRSSGRSSGRNSGAISALVILVVIVALVGSLIGFVIWPNLIYPNQTTDELKTPEILQTYSGTYKTTKSQGNAIVTFTSCDDAGNVKGHLEFILDEAYGKYEIIGKILSKKNNGNLTMSVSPGKWIVQPENFSQLETMEIKISDKYQTFKCTKYSMYWSAGENDEFAIKTPEDFSKLGGSAATFQLRNDIDLSGYDWTPIEGFTGTLIGNGFAIRNLKINASSSDVGLFSVLKGAVLNLKIENAEITVSGRNENVGILCGQLVGTATNVTVSGSVIAEKCANVGGVCGYVSSVGTYVLSEITNDASVTGLSCVGGCFGRVYDYISNGVNPYTVTLSNLKNNGTVTCEDDYAGGIVGHIDGTATGIGGSLTITIIDCDNKGSVTGTCHVAGIVGYACSDTGSVIESCTNVSSINAEAFTGCIAGSTMRFVILDCTNEGSELNATGYFLEEGKKYAYVGGIVGKGTCLRDCANYVDIQYTGGGDFVGGLMGFCDVGPAVTGYSLASDTAEANFKNLVNYGSISGSSYVGGIIGGIMYFWTNGCKKLTATFESLINSGNVYAEMDYVGGISGYMAGDVGGIGGSMSWCIYDCENAASVVGNANVGGLFGGFLNGEAGGTGFARNQVIIDGCSSTGERSGNANVGELIGLDEIKR